MIVNLYCNLHTNVLIIHNLLQAYAGHQFGHFTTGDGRAILLGENQDSYNKLYDIQLKGAGKKSFSRAGDGRATLSSILREYLISESMYNLKYQQQEV